jgi:hypothetical protein
MRQIETIHSGNIVIVLRWIDIYRLLDERWAHPKRCGGRMDQIDTRSASGGFPQPALAANSAFC